MLTRSFPSAVSSQLDFKVGWKKLKEVFGMAGTVKRADVKEDKDGKSRGMGTVTFEQALEAVQAICILYILPQNTPTFQQAADYICIFIYSILCFTVSLGSM